MRICKSKRVPPQVICQNTAQGLSGMSLCESAELESHVEGNASIAVFVPILEQFMELARVHFNHEEEMMGHDAYPVLGTHRLQHENLLRYLELLIGQVANGRLDVDKNLITALWDWGTVHIETYDREYANYKGRRQSSQ